MVKKAARPLESRWTPRDTFAAAALFAATAAFVLWQNAHVAVLFDLSYILNTAGRIALGQVPYRDFPLAHAPLTFVLQAAIIRLTGRVIFHHVLYVATVGGLGTVLTWRMALNLLRGRVLAAWILALLLTAPLVFLGVYSIVPNPEYDCDCGFWLLVALWSLGWLDTGGNNESAARGGRLNLSWRGFAAGTLACVPIFFKQNMGVPFLLAAMGAVALLLALRMLPQKQVSEAAPATSALLGFLAGAVAALAIALLELQATAGLNNFFHWTVQYAGQRRLPGLDLMLGVYRDPTLLYTLPCVAAALVLLRFGGKFLWARIAAFVLLAAPFVYTLVSLAIYDDADERSDSLLALWPFLLILAAALALVNLIGPRRELRLRAFFPLLLLAAIHGTFMSQQLWGSTYGIWALLVLLVAELIACLEGFSASAPVSRWFVPALTAIISVTLLVCGGFYAVSEERLSYANQPDGPAEHSAFPALAGLATPGPYVPEIDELLRYAQANIPFDDGILILPGEEPFYFATGRVPHFPVPFFDPTIDPYTSAEIASLARSRKIRWLIVKRDVQTKEDPTPDRAALLATLLGDYKLVEHLRGYDVYRR
jgi:hypothetical protein